MMVSDVGEDPTSLLSLLLNVEHFSVLFLIIYGRPQIEGSESSNLGEFYRILVSIVSID